MVRKIRCLGFRESIILHQARLRHNLQGWNSAWSDLSNKPGSAQWQNDNRAGILTLGLVNKMLKIMLDVDVFDPEMHYDLYIDTFREIVSDAEELIQLTSGTATSSMGVQSERSSSAGSSKHTPRQSGSNIQAFDEDSAAKTHSLTPPFFTLSLGCVEGLYFCAARCRDHKIRHKAFSILRSCRRREGLWDSNGAAIVAERLIAMEESDSSTAVSSSIKNSPDEGHIDVLQHRNSMRNISIPFGHGVKGVNHTFGSETHARTLYSMDYSPNANTLMYDRLSGFSSLCEW